MTSFYTAVKQSGGIHAYSGRYFTRNQKGRGLLNIASKSFIGMLAKSNIAKSVKRLGKRALNKTKKIAKKHGRAALKKVGKEIKKRGKVAAQRTKKVVQKHGKKMMADLKREMLANAKKEVNHVMSKKKTIKSAVRDAVKKTGMKLKDQTRDIVNQEFKKGGLRNNLKKKKPVVARRKKQKQSDVFCT